VGERNERIALDKLIPCRVYKRFFKAIMYIHFAAKQKVRPASSMGDWLERVVINVRNKQGTSSTSL
jgi:hypothetical protein